MNRRAFLKAITSSTVAAAALTVNGPGLWFRNAHAANGKMMLIVSQRGGCDGLNTCVPYGDPDYYKLRPTIAIARPKANNPESALDLDGFFGLHPALSGLKEIYTQGDLAVMPAVHYPDSLRSHFHSQSVIETGTPALTPDGWLNRYLQEYPAVVDLQAIAFSKRMPELMRGSLPVAVVSDLDEFALNMDTTERDMLVASLERVYSQATSLVSPHTEKLLSTGIDMIDDVELMKMIDPSSYQPSNGAVYPDTTFGRQMRQVAFLAKSGVGLEFASVEINGWDTHSSQGGGEVGGRQAVAFKEFGDGIAAFHRDMGALMANVVIVTGTEFGRTAAENASNGTDHGGASTWFAVGKNVQGGIYGNWPGLAPGQLQDNRQLQFNIDFRDVFSEVLARHLGNSQLANIFPGHSQQAVGFL